MVLSRHAPLRHRPADSKSRQLLILVTIVFSLMGCGVTAYSGRIAFYCTSYVLITTPYITYWLRSRDVFAPGVGLLALVFLYSVSTLLYVGVDMTTYYGEPVSVRALETFRIATLVAASGIAIGSLFASRSLLPVASVAAPSERSEDFRAINVLAMAFGILLLPFYFERFFPWNATSYGEVALSTRLEAMADPGAGLTEVFTRIVPEMLVYLASAQIMIFWKGFRVVRVLATALVFGYLATAFLSGLRGQLMLSITILACLYHYRVKRITLFGGLSSAAAVYLLINILSVARISSNPFEMAQLVVDEFGFQGAAMLSLQNSGELATSTNLLRLIQGVEDGETEFKFGRLALSQLASFVPRVVYPGRPGFGSEQFTKEFYPEVFERGGGYGFFLPQDGYWDFGIPGIFLYSLLYGGLVSVAYTKLIGRFNTHLSVAVFAILYSQLIIGAVRGGIFAAVKSSIIVLAPIFLVLVYIRCRRSYLRRGRRSTARPVST